MMTAGPPPIWERRPSVGHSQTLPSIGNLAGLNGSSTTNDIRDSGNWSLASSSQRASNSKSHAAFFTLFSLLLPLSSLPLRTFLISLLLRPVSEVSQVPLQLPPIDASRNSPGEHPSYTQSPVATGFGASTTSLHSTHTTPPANQYASHNGDLPTPSPSASRRSSFDSRLGNLQLSSPVNGTPAASQVSLSSTLLNSNRDSLTSQMLRDRGIHSSTSPHSCPPPPPSQQQQQQPPPPPPQPHHPHDASDRAAPHNPFGFRPSQDGARPGAGPTRTAPPIVGSSRYPYSTASHPNAPSPTKGIPWAFPDPEIIEPQGRTHQDAVNGRTSTTSLAGSAASSIYGSSAVVSPHPSHPHMPPMMSLNGHLGSNHSLPQIGQATHHHHHHGLANRRLSIIGDSQQSPTPYSRTPELRVSHKLAERKRRKEMKELFDELRDALPAERGGKSSKWEVLTKGVSCLLLLAGKET